MPKITTPLTDTEIKKAKTTTGKKGKNIGLPVANKLSDGGGLCLIVPLKGSKYFRFDYTYNGKRKSISLGTYPETSLKLAREKRANAKELLAQDVDPSENRKIQNQDGKTFKEVVNEWLNKTKITWSEGTYKGNKENIYNNAIKELGNKPVKDITRLDILQLLNIMQSRGVYELQTRLLNLLNRVYKYAVSYNIVDHNIIADIDKTVVLNAPAKKNFGALTKEKDIKILMNDIKNYKDTFNGDISTVYALELIPYVFTRPYNVRFAEWSEFDLKKGIWEIPAHKMKGNKDFIIPLPKQAIEIIKKVKPYSKHKSKYLFPSPTSNQKPLSENTLNQALMRMGYKDRHTSHGFRAMFSSVAHERIKEHGFYSEVIEFSLAHEEKNQVKAAYNRQDKMKYYEERKKLLQWYADWLDGI